MVVATVPAALSPQPARRAAIPSRCFLLWFSAGGVRKIRRQIGQVVSLEENEKRGVSSERETLCVWVVPSRVGAVPARPSGGALTVAAVGSAFLACGRGLHSMWNHIFLICCVVRTECKI